MRIVMTGASGLVGGLLLPLLSKHAVTIVGRRELPEVPAGTAQRVAPMEQWPGLVEQAPSDVAICCLGTTIRQAGSQAAFRAVDHDLVLATAEGARRGGARQMILVSSVGAAAKSGTFYLRTKGETEDGLRALGFERLDILRPGLLTGNRAGPARFGEGLAMAAAPLTDALMHGALRRYRSIPGETVARAIVALAGRSDSGVHIHENDVIRVLAD